MDLGQALDAEHSKAQTLRITEHIGGSRKRFAELVAIVAGEDRTRAQRGAWVISHVAERRPEVVLPFIGSLLENLRPTEDRHDAIKRNTMKAASELDLPEEVGGLAVDLAFTLLGSPDEAVATKVYAMSTIERLCHREPGLIPELRLSLEHQLPRETKPAFRSRARQVLTSLDRLETASRD